MIKWFTLFSIVITYILIVFGGYVASSESGMGCGPEWPLCNGEVIPILQDDTLIEFAHRVIGLLLVLVVSILFFQLRKTRTIPNIRSAAWWMISLLTLQVLAGAVVVVLDLPAIIVTLHLIVAMMFILSLLWIYRAEHITIFQASLGFKDRKFIKKNLNVVIVFLLLTLGVGAYIKHQSYGLACGWLDCGDTLLPGNTPQVIQTLHRSLAVITVIYLMYLTSLAYAKRWGQRIQNRLLIATIIAGLQLFSGVLTIITNIMIPWAVIHLAIGTALFMIIVDTRLQSGNKWGD